MPKRAKKICSVPGCPSFAYEGSLCVRHGAERVQRVEQARPNAAQRGYGARWRRAAAAYLQAHPSCACGCGRPSSIVDHIVPHRGDAELFWNQSNWQALSKHCHSRKTAAQDGGFGNRAVHNRVGGW